MTEDPTLIVVDLDDERTLVDPRFARRDEPSRSTFQPNARRRSLEGVIGYLLLLFVLAVVAFQQWRVADALRESMARMELDRGQSSSFSVREPAHTPAVPTETSHRADVAAADLGPTERDFLERAAADALASNDFRTALARYRELVAFHPEAAVFRHIVAILRFELHCDRPGTSRSPACD